MVKIKPFELLSYFPNISKFSFKFVLGVLLLSFFLNYQPTLAFPPIKKNLVHAQEINQQVQQINPAALPIQFQLPHNGYITTPFSSYHLGIDLATGLGMPIKPIAKGTIISTGYNFWGLGLVVEIDHGSGYKSLYAHMGKIYATPGKTVNINDYIGEVGLTGHTSGPHTHLEISKDGQKINPLSVLPEVRNYPTEQDFITLHSSTPSTVQIPQAPKTVTQETQPSQKPPTSIPIQTPTPQLLTSLLPNLTKSESPKDPLNNLLNPNLLH